MKKLSIAVVAALTGAMAVMSASQVSAQATPDDPAVVAAAVTAGAPLYARNCAGCHGNEGQGGNGPMLFNNQFVAQQSSVVNQIFLGNAERGMPGFTQLSNEDIANLTTFVRNSWGNAFGLTTADYVGTVRPTGG